MKYLLLIFIKPQPNDSNISTQHILTTAQQISCPTKPSQHLNATDRTIYGRNMLRVFGHPVATCWGILQVENWTSAHAQAQQCWTNLAKPLQNHATSANIARKNWPVSNLTEQHPTSHITSQQGGQTHATCCTQQSSYILRSHHRDCDRFAGALHHNSSGQFSIVICYPNHWLIKLKTRS